MCSPFLLAPYNEKMSECAFFQGRKYLNAEMVKKLDAILVLKVIGDDCGHATWLCDAKHGEGNLQLVSDSEGFLQINGTRAGFSNFPEPPS